MLDSVEEAWERLDHDWCPALYDEEVAFQAAVREAMVAAFDDGVSRVLHGTTRLSPGNAILEGRWRLEALGGKPPAEGEKET